LLRAKSAAVGTLASRHARLRRTTWLVPVLALAVLASAFSSTSPGPPPNGDVTNLRVPASIRDLPLTNQMGKTVTLASWPGKTILLVPFLTLCQDICPMTTGNLVQVERALQADHASSKVQIVELSVDPQRDTAARLAAYEQLTGLHWQLVTETPENLTAISKFFGFYYQVVPEDSPPGIDWWTGQPLTYDVNHSDGFVVINPRGIERFFTAGAPNFHGKLPPALKRFLSALGREHLKNPPTPNYTPSYVLQALGWSMNRSLPLAKE
jgi:protein SCO1/2